MEDARLEAMLRRARDGEPQAFAELYAQFSRRVFGLCRHLLGSAEEAEDATSEVFLKVQKSLATYDLSFSFPRWLLTVAGNHCLDRLRRRRVEFRLFAADAEDDPATAVAAAPACGPSPLAEALAEEQQEQVREAIARLPERLRVPLVMRYYSELSYEQIAQATGLKRNHVATLIFRAKQELRKALSEGAP